MTAAVNHSNSPAPLASPSDPVDGGGPERRSRAAGARRAAVRATRAPSVHNTQPWRFVLGRDALEVHADWSRQLTVLDPEGRQLLLSCGCALFNARVSLAAADAAVKLQRLPDPGRPTLVARLGLTGHGEPEPSLAALDAVIDTRQSNRRRFEDMPVPDDVVDTLITAARLEGAQLVPVHRREHRLAVARLSQLADRIENAQPGYRAELRRWTGGDSFRPDGVPAASVPHADGSSEDDIPIRDFDTQGVATLPGHTRSSIEQCLLLLGTNADTPAAWIRAGEALERVWLELTARGYTVSLFSQLIEVPTTRAQLRVALGLRMQPHMLLRVGRAAPTPATRRRRLVDVLSYA